MKELRKAKRLAWNGEEIERIVDELRAL
jgi:hypothetical protein